MQCIRGRQQVLRLVLSELINFYFPRNHQKTSFSDDFRGI